MQNGWRRWRRLGVGTLVLLVFVPAAALLWPVSAMAQGADDLATTIEQNLAGIAFRLEMRPEMAATELKVQKSQLELLEQEAPDHPALPGLKREFAALQDELASALTAAARGDGMGMVPTPPAGFDAGMEQVEALQQRAEEEFLRGETESASSYLQQAEAQVAALESRYGSEIPRGHVPLLVAKETIAALKEQVADKVAR